MPPSKFNQIGFCCLIHPDLAESQSTGVRFLLVHCGGVWGFPGRRTPPHIPTLGSQSVPLFYERHSSCGVGFDTSGKDLWRRVISSGHSPSADVRKPSHSWVVWVHQRLYGWRYQQKHTLPSLWGVTMLFMCVTVCLHLLCKTNSMSWLHTGRY